MKAGVFHNTIYSVPLANSLLEYKNKEGSVCSGLIDLALESEVGLCPPSAGAYRAHEGSGLAAPALAWLSKEPNFSICRVVVMLYNYLNVSR